MKGDPRAMLDSACRVKASRTASSFVFVIERILPIRLANPASRHFESEYAVSGDFGFVLTQGQRLGCSAATQASHGLALKIEAACFEEEFALFKQKAERGGLTKLYARHWL